MGLSAVVYKNIATIKSEFGEASYEVDPDTGEVSFLDGSERSLTSGLEIAVRRDFGNVAQVGFLRQEASNHLGDRAIVCELILYSGSHSGDFISMDKNQNLEKEVKILHESTKLGDVEKFCDDIYALMEASRTEKNPIVFI